MNRIKILFSQTHYQAMEERHLRYLFKNNLKGKSLLDIGCGNGKYLHALSTVCSKITGVDINSEQVIKLRNKGFDVYTPKELPCQNKYDILLMSHIVEHFDTNGLLKFIDHYLPMLAEDGVLIISTPMPGIRFWHDYTHVRPYTPQSLGMLFGILGGPVAFQQKQKMRLENIWFFRDSWRIRNSRYYYPSEFITPKSAVFHIYEKIISGINIIFAILHAISRGRLGTISSWIGIYRKDAFKIPQ